jgi:hypothetical protein
MTEQQKLDPIKRARDHLASFDRHIVYHYYNRQPLCWHTPYSGTFSDVAKAADALDSAEAVYTAAKAKGPDFAALVVDALNDAESRFSTELRNLCAWVTGKPETAGGQLKYLLDPKIGKAGQIAHLTKCLDQSKRAAQVVAEHPDAFSVRERITAKHVTTFSRNTLDQVTKAWARADAKYLARESAA